MKNFKRWERNFLSWSWVEPFYLCEAWMKMRHPVTDDLRVEKLDWTQAGKKDRHNSSGEVAHLVMRPASGTDAANEIKEYVK
jgi:hypothetical protein